MAQKFIAHIHYQYCYGMKQPLITAHFNVIPNSDKWIKVCLG